MIWGVRSVHSLEFGKHGPAGGRVEDGAVASLGTEVILFDLHGVLLALLLERALMLPAERGFFC